MGEVMDRFTIAKGIRRSAEWQKIGAEQKETIRLKTAEGTVKGYMNGLLSAGPVGLPQDNDLLSMASYLT